MQFVTSENGWIMLGTSLVIGFIFYYRNKKKQKRKQPPQYLNNSKEFQEAVQESQNLKNLEQDKQLLLYAFFKQSTIGKCNIEKPPAYDLTNVYKYQAWKHVEQLSKAEAEEHYIKLVDSLKNVNPEESQTQNEERTGFGFGFKVSTIIPSVSDNNDQYIEKFNLQDQQNTQESTMTSDQQSLHQKLDDLVKNGDLTQFSNTFEKIGKEEYQTYLKHANQQGISLLHQTIDQGQAKIFSYLLPYYKEASLINLQEEISGMTPLHYAAMVEDEFFIDQLLKVGAYKNITDFSGDKPLDNIK